MEEQVEYAHEDKILHKEKHQLSLLQWNLVTVLAWPRYLKCALASAQAWQLYISTYPLTQTMSNDTILVTDMITKVAYH